MQNVIYFDGKSPSKQEKLIDDSIMPSSLPSIIQQNLKCVYQMYEDEEINLVFWHDENAKEAAVALFFDYFDWNYKKSQTFPNIKKRILILMESMSVQSEQYDEKVYSKFDIVLSWADDLVDNKKVFKINCPKYIVPSCNIQEPDWENWSKRKEIVVIQSNKYSFFPTELYSERRRALDFFSKKSSINVDLYGFGWQKGNYISLKRSLGYFARLLKSLIKYKQFHKFFFYCREYISINKNRSYYKGQCDDKYATLANYKYNICFENDVANGCISEKIIDGFYNGTVSLYLGAKNIHDYIPSDIFIDCSQFASYSSLEKYLIKIGDSAENIAKKAYQYVTSEDYFSNWSVISMHQIIIKHIKSCKKGEI